MSTYNKCFYGETIKILPSYSPTLLLSYGKVRSTTYLLSTDTYYSIHGNCSKISHSNSIFVSDKLSFGVQTFAHKTIAHKTVDHKKIAHKTIAHNLNGK